MHEAYGIFEEGEANLIKKNTIYLDDVLNIYMRTMCTPRELVTTLIASPGS